MLVDGRDDQDRARVELSNVIGWLIERNADYAANRSHVEVLFRWRGGKLELVREEHQHLPANLKPRRK